MKRLVAFFVCLFACSQAFGAWQYRQVCQTVQIPVQVKVYPDCPT